MIDLSGNDDVMPRITDPSARFLIGRLFEAAIRLPLQHRIGGEFGATVVDHYAGTCERTSLR